MTMAEKIKDARLKLKISKTELARRLHTTTQAIYKYENGIVTNIPALVLFDIFQRFGIVGGQVIRGSGKNHCQKQAQNPAEKQDAERLFHHGTS